MSRSLARWLAIAGALVAGWLLYVNFTARALDSVAVLPFENQSSDPEESDYLADGISQSVITRLAQVGLRVTPWETARRYRDRVEAPEELARRLNVDAALIGSFQLEGERILTRLTLVEAESGLVTWAEELEEPFSDLFQVQRRIAEGAAASLKRSLTGEEREVLAAPESESIEAYDLYLQGAHFLQAGDEESVGLAHDYFTRAATLDPDLAEAHVGVGAVEIVRYAFGWDGRSSLDRARTSFERALRQNPDLLEARRGLIQVNFYGGTSEEMLHQGREAERRGGENDVKTLLVQAEAHHYGGLTESSIPIYQRIMELDPENQAAHWHVVNASFWSGRQQFLAETGERYLRLFGDDYDIHAHMGAAFHLLGEDARAREHYEQVIDTAGRYYHLVFAGLFLEKAGEPERAREIWRFGRDSAAAVLALNPDNRIVRSFHATFHGLLGDTDSFERESELARGGSGGYADYYLAATHVRLGQHEQGAELLAHMLERRAVTPNWRIGFQMYGISVPDTESFRRFEQDYEAFMQDLRERF